MSDVALAVIAVFGFGFLTGLGFGVVVRRRAPSPAARVDSVSLRLRAVRRSRVAIVEQRIEALERAITSAASSPDRTGRVYRASRPIADPDALEALLALGYRRTEAVARLAAVPDAATTTEDRITAVLRVSGAAR